MKHKVTYLLLALLASVSLRAQNNTLCPAATNMGTDFWVAIIYNYHETPSYNPGQLSITCVGNFSIHKKIRSIWWPNVFTPDEERNNRFGCTVTYEIVAFEMHIYNRQGLLVYHTTDPSATWDGTHEGKPCPQGAYVYRWHAKYAYGYVKNGVGTVTLIR